ncbi:MAG: asparagine synthetase B family protein [Gemmatimonadaceae bacterium]
MSTFVAELLRGDGPVSASTAASSIADVRAGSWIVGHVRLDGRDALRDALGGAGVATGNSATDAELVLAAWTAWRETATERLIGDYSFALWDHRQRTLFCARDALGVRPLYWAEIGRTFVCSNVLDEVRARARVSSRLHAPAIVSFLQHGYNADTSTTSFADVRRLPPGHQFVVRDDSSSILPRKYWSFPVPARLRVGHDDEYVERFRDVLGEAVRDRLRTDRAAILLSGGLDSTSIAATARRVAPATRLSAWTNDAGAAQPPDENRLAAAVAATLGIAHEVVRAEPAPFMDPDDTAFRTPEPLDEPEWRDWVRQLGQISSVAPVLLSGEDGDALFRPPGLLTMLRSWPVHDILRRVLSYTISHRHHPHLGLWLRRRLLAPFVPRADRVWRWIRRDARARLPALPSTVPHATRPDAVRYLADPIWQGMLESAQPAYTGVPLEIVWPFLDVRVMEFVFSIPPVPWCQRKELVRRAFRGELPDEVLTRPKEPLRGFFEEQAARWSAAAHQPTLGDAVREFVDTRSVADTLKTGSVDEVLAVRRVFVLDQWLRNLERSPAARSIRGG